MELAEMAGKLCHSAAALEMDRSDNTSREKEAPNEFSLA